MSIVWTLPLAVGNVLVVPRSVDPQAALGEAIRQLRVQRGLTQEDLAHDAQITTGTLSVIERGGSNPGWATVRRIARALQVPTAELATLAERLEERGR